MYRCEACNQVVGPRVKAIRLVVETRPRDYKDNWKRGGKIGHGTEIVREITACPACAGVERT